eukprot:1156864-Pelagomonas_calceolata.AAC.6
MKGLRGLPRKCKLYTLCFTSLALSHCFYSSPPFIASSVVSSDTSISSLSLATHAPYPYPPGFAQQL